MNYLGVVSLLVCFAITLPGVRKRKDADLYLLIGVLVRFASVLFYSYMGDADPDGYGATELPRKASHRQEPQSKRFQRPRAWKIEQRRQNAKSKHTRCQPCPQNGHFQQFQVHRQASLDRPEGDRRLRQ